MKNSSGVTLIELVAVISIGGILATIILASLGHVKISAKLDAELKNVGAAIETAQSYALQGKSQLGTSVCGYGFRFSDSESYEIFYNALDGSFANCEEQNQSGEFRQYNGESEAAEEYALQTGITRIAPDLVEAEIYFDIPNGNAYSREGQEFSGMTLTLGLPDGGLEKSINLNSKAHITN